MKVLLSVSPNWGIGTADGSLLYKNSMDMQIFKGLTQKCDIIAGRKTAETMIGGLKNRRCFAIAQNHIHGWTSVTYEYAKDVYPEAWIIGGAFTIDSLLPYITEFWISFFQDKPDVSDGRQIIHLSDKTVDVINKCRRFVLFENQQFVFERLIVI